MKPVIQFYLFHALLITLKLVISLLKQNWCLLPSWRPPWSSLVVDIKRLQIDCSLLSLWPFRPTPDMLLSLANRVKSTGTIMRTFTFQSVRTHSQLRVRLFLPYKPVMLISGEQPIMFYIYDKTVLSCFMWPLLNSQYSAFSFSTWCGCFDLFLSYSQWYWYFCMCLNVLGQMYLDRYFHSWGRTGPTRGLPSSTTL